MKKLVSVVLAAAILLAMCVLPVGAAAVTELDDNFDSYTAAGYLTGGGKTIAGDWYANDSVDDKSFGYDSNARAGIVANPDGDGNVLAIEARAAYNYPNMAPTLVNKGVTVTAADTWTYSFDFYKTANEGNAAWFPGGGGIRFNVSGSNYYELFFAGLNAYTDGTQYTSLSKCTDGTYVRLSANIKSTVANNYLTPETWYSVVLTVKQGKISWTVQEKATGTTFQMGSYTDTNPFGMEAYSVELFGMGQGLTFALFDNVVITSETQTSSSGGSGEHADALIYETFEDYEAADYIQGTNRQIAGEWWSEGAGYDGAGYAGITESPSGTGGNVLAIEGRSAYDASKAFPTITNGAVTFNKDDIYHYQFDMYTTSILTSDGLSYRAGGGIRFNVSDTGYYDLQFMGSRYYSDGTYATSLQKNVGGIVERLSPTITCKDAENHLAADTWYTIKVDVEKGNISWTVTRRATGTVFQTGSYSDKYAFRDDSFTMSLFAAEQGGSYAFFDNIIVTTEESDTSLDDMEVLIDEETYLTEDGEYLIYNDLFGGYNSQNGCVDDENPVTTILNDTTVAENEIASWKLSKIHCDTGKPSAYVEPLGKQMITTGITRYDTHPYESVVNLNLKNGSAKELAGVSVDGAFLENCRWGFRMAISADEETYYEFGRGSWYDFTEEFNPSSNPGNLAEPTGLPKRAPYLVKCVNGERSLVAYFNDTVAADGIKLTQWDITIDGDQINISCYCSYSQKTWTATVTDTDGILEGFQYPMALWSTNSCYFDNVSVRYKPQAPVYVDNGDNTATISILPAQYSKTAASLTVVTAFYRADGTATDAHEQTITEETSYDVEIPADAASAEVLIFEGSVADGKLLRTVPAVEEDAEPAKEDKFVIAAIGDSLTGNDGLYSNHTWPTKLNVLLGEDYIVKNYGKPSMQLMHGNDYSYTGCQQYLDSLESEADLVLIMLGTNDSGGWTESMSDADKKARSQKFYDDYVTLINTYRNLPTNPDIIIAVPPIRGYADAKLEQADIYIKPIIQQLSKDLDIPYIDMYSLVTDYDLLYDGTHFHDAGYFQFAQHFYEAVTKQVNVTADLDMGELYVNSTASFDSPAAVAVYNGNTLKDVKLFDSKFILSNKDVIYDISDMDYANGDSIQLMFLDENLAPYTYASVKTINAAEKTVAGVKISGEAGMCKDVLATVLDVSGAVVLADTQKTGMNGHYEFTFTLPAGKYTVVHGVSGQTTQTNIVVE